METKDLLALLQHFGGQQYSGEPVSQIEHAWQCGVLARQSGATSALQLASWLHDIGHLLVGWTGTPTLDGRNDGHESIAAEVLFRLWGEAVSEPVRLHVHAKRYLVSRQSGYLARLSQDSLRSLMLQGGPMSAQQMDAFEREPYYKDALQLRVWDDLAKSAGWYADSDAQALLQLQQLMSEVTDKSL